MKRVEKFTLRNKVFTLSVNTKRRMGYPSPAHEAKPYTSDGTVRSESVRLEILHNKLPGDIMKLMEDSEPKITEGETPEDLNNQKYTLEARNIIAEAESRGRKITDEEKKVFTDKWTKAMKEFDQFLGELFPDRNKLPPVHIDFSSGAIELDSEWKSRDNSVNLGSRSSIVK